MSLARTLAYALAGTAWLLVDFVRWRTHGMLASSTLVDVVRLTRAHEAHLSQVSVICIAALPIVGAGLAALSVWRSRVVAGLRVALALAGCGVSIGLLTGLGNGVDSSFGPGAWLAVAGLACAVLGAAFDATDVAIQRRALESAS